MTMQDDELTIIRRAYAKQVAHAARARDPRIEAALAELRREEFLPPGPWQIMRFPDGYQQTPDADPVYVYQDAAVGIRPEKRLNNGQPSFLIFLIASGGLKDGEHAIHIGTGTGYYTAVMSHLAGLNGRVTGIELEQDLAAEAKINLARYSNVDVINGDGATLPLAPADVIYVNAGASRPAETWLDALKPGGRMVLPLTVRFATQEGHAMTRGAVFLIWRDADGRIDHYPARCISPTIIFPCAGARDEASEEALIQAFKKPDIGKVTGLCRSDDIAEERCWLRAPGWSLIYG